MTAAPHVASWYSATAPVEPAQPPLAGDLDADVCVVGGGYTGLSAALELAERGYAVVLLEANRLGWGASGRNGGQICTGFSSPFEKVEDWVGADDARRLFACAEEAKAILRERIERHAIDCDLRWGYFHAADRPRELAECDEVVDLWGGRYGYGELQVVRSAEVVRRDVVDSPRYIGGLVDAGAGHLHPLKYCLGLARAAQAAGVRVFEGSRVVAIERGPRPRVRTSHGAVRSSFVVVACNAYLGHLLPEIRAKIMPVGTYVAATAPLGQERATRLLPGDHAVADMKFVLNYFRRSSDHRLLFGGRGSYTTIAPTDLGRAMRRSMLSVFPQLGDVGFDSVWGGNVAITMERSPHVGRLGDNLYFAQGYSGTGVPLSAIAARVIAEAVAGQAERLDLFARLPHTTFPGGTWLRAPTLALAMLWYRLRDLRP